MLIFYGPYCLPTSPHAPRFRYISCTTDAETVWADTPAPSSAPIGEYSSFAVDTPAPTTGFGDRTVVETLAPTIRVDNGSAADTPAPANDVDDDGTAHAPAPLGDEHGDTTDPDTPAPTVRTGRGISVTLSPIAESGPGEEEETSPPSGSDAVTLANGARGRSNSITVRGAILSCAVVIFTGFIM